MLPKSLGRSSRCAPLCKELSRCHSPDQGGPLHTDVQLQLWYTEWDNKSQKLLLSITEVSAVQHKCACSDERVISRFESKV